MTRISAYSIAMLGLAVTLAGEGCSRSNSTAGSTREPPGAGFTDEQPHVSTATGGIGSGPTGTQGSQPADVPPER